MGQIERFTGHTVAEAGSLALGGALYGVVNTSMARYAKPVHNILAKVPVVGSSLPTLVAGALLNYLGERQGIAALQTVGKGLVGASVVGMGVNAAQMIPGLKGASPVSGVDYTLEGDDYGTLPEGMGEGDEADFGGVDFTMEGHGQMGDDDYAGVDFTMEGYGDEADFGDDADFGTTPEGLGEGQMG